MGDRPAQRVVILGKAIAAEAMAMAAKAGVTVIPSDCYLQGEELQTFLAENDPDAIILRLGGVDDAAMSSAPRLKIIAKHGVGYDTIAVDAASRRGIAVSIATAANAISVAEHALALMFGVARGIAYLDSRMRNGHWDKADFLGTELNGKVLGIVGIGAIGLHLATICKALGMEIVAYDPAPASPAEGELRRAGSLAELLEAGDVVSLHCPLTPATRDMIDANALAMMKPRSILINTARGGLVDIDAVLTALEDGQIGGAGLDTFPDEPPVISEALRRQGKLVLSPHVGASTVEAGARVGTVAMGQVLDCLAGRAIEDKFLVNKAALGSGNAVAD